MKFIIKATVVHVTEVEAESKEQALAMIGKTPLQWELVPGRREAIPVSEWRQEPPSVE